MENLIFSLNATIPIFLMMVLGVFFRKTGLLKENMINGLNQFVFKATLPVLLFGDLAKQDFAEAWNGKFVAFCFVVTLVSISLVALMSMALKDKSQRGEFIQKTGTEWDESGTDQKDLKGNCDQSDHSGNSGRCIVVSLTASDANNPDKDGFQSWRSDNTSRTDGNGRCL